MDWLLNVGVLLLLWWWVGLCRWLRRKRVSFIQRLDPVQQRHQLTKMALFVEFPLLSLKGIEFAVLRCFGIPSISGLLSKTLLSSKKRSLKAFDDAAVLAEEMLLYNADSGRGSLAIRRINFIHSRYAIDNEQYLYNLSVFVLEPMRWAARFGPRPWTPNESAAVFNVWRDIGKGMGIQHIPETLQELHRFSDDYEQRNMVYADSNRRAAEASLELMLGRIPWLLRPGMTMAALALIDERLLKALGWRQQPKWVVWMVNSCLRFFAGKLVAWFMPPRRLSWSTERIIFDEDEEDVLRKVKYDIYGSGNYRNGYRIANLGSAPPGKLGHAFGGPALCCPFLVKGIPSIDSVTASS